MKRCPTCNRTYTDPNLSFCTEDGTPLQTEEPAGGSSVLSPYSPPGSYQPPVVREKRRRAWPWVLGLGGAFGLGAIVLLIAAAVLVPRLAKPVEGNKTTETTETTDKVETVVDAPPPADEKEVLAQLTEIESEWTKANINADKEKLGRILAEDYVGQSADGGLMGKTEYLNAIEPDTSIEKWELRDLKLQLAAKRATLTGEITYVFSERTLTYKFTDRFVWRNGRWQATGSEIQARE